MTTTNTTETTYTNESTETMLSDEAFDQLLKTQYPETTKWRELVIGKIYKVVSKKIINTEKGESTIITLADGTRVWACSALEKRLEEDKHREFPCYIRSNGEIQSKKNKAYKYFGFDLVWHVNK